MGKPAVRGRGASPTSPPDAMSEPNSTPDTDGSTERRPRIPSPDRFEPHADREQTLTDHGSKISSNMVSRLTAGADRLKTSELDHLFESLRRSVRSPGVSDQPQRQHDFTRTGSRESPNYPLLFGK